MDAERQIEISRAALRTIGERCPRLAKMCYWAGTAAIAIEELHHRQSFDLDFHTREALYDIRPILAEIRAAFPGTFELVTAPDEFGSGFQGILALPDDERITIEVLSNYEDVPASDLVDAETSPCIKRVSLLRYLADKVQCVAERVEARDLVDILFVLRKSPGLEASARRLLAEQDAVLLVERLQGWSDRAIEDDLLAYDDVSADDAREARDLLLQWITANVAEDLQP
ncbi:nucleotidyl transferase AbiEii/AbiGii toxin family protein [Verrucomicrobiota bacterium]